MNTKQPLFCACGAEIINPHVNQKRCNACRFPPAPTTRYKPQTMGERREAKAERIAEKQQAAVSSHESRPMPVNLPLRTRAAKIYSAPVLSSEPSTPVSKKAKRFQEMLGSLKK